MVTTRPQGVDRPVDGWGARDTCVLLAAVQQYQQEGRCTMRGVAARAGWSLVRTYAALQRLRRAGLVTWVPETSGTLRPLVFHVQPLNPKETPCEPSRSR